MSYHVEYSDTALKQLKKMDRFDARLITSWIGKNLEGCSDPRIHGRSSPVEWCNRFVSFGVGYALSWSGVSSCPVGWGVSRDLVRMSRLR